MKRLLITLAFALLATGLFAAPEAIAPSDKLPSIDGSVATGEYTWTKKMGNATISFSVGSDGLAYLAISAPTNGWVALGFGSDRMNNALIAMAYDDGKQPFFVEQKGAGHGHSDVSTPSVQKWSVKNDNGTTTLEISFDSKLATVGDQIKLIFAFGRDTNLKNRHQERGSLTFSVKS